jgi:glycosidase
LDELAELGFDWIYFLSVWQTGEIGKQVSLNHPQWLEEYRQVCPDFTEEDVGGSGFAIVGYTLNTELGGEGSLSRLRERLYQRGMRLMLDFVPNHTAIDHPWVKEHPEFYVGGTEELLQREPQNYIKLEDGQIFAYGRDPYFPGWPDALQLNYAKPEVQEMMIAELGKIARQCDGLRCDMAMLILPEVFEHTWGLKAEPFWQKAIAKVRKEFPDFMFMAEVYWDLGWTLQQIGFDYTYDKRLYDRLREKRARLVNEHFWADLDYQNKLVRFLENHDETRAAASFSPSEHQAAAVISFLCPGLRFFHQGQLEGWQKHIPVHLCRAAEQTTDEAIREFYQKLLACLRLPVVRNGTWELLDRFPAWLGNPTWDCFIAFTWEGQDEEKLLVLVNYAPNQSQGYIRLPFTELGGLKCILCDLMSGIIYDRTGDSLISGVYFDLPPWGYHVFSLEMVS